MPKIEISNNEKNVIRRLVSSELKSFEDEGKNLRDITPDFLEAEEKYDLILKNILKKVSKNERR